MTALATAGGGSVFRLTYIQLYVPTSLTLQGRNARGDEGLFPATYITEETNPINNEKQAPVAEGIRPDASPYKGTDPLPEPIPTAALSPLSIPQAAPEAPTTAAEALKGKEAPITEQSQRGANGMGETLGEIQNAIESIAEPQGENEQEDLGIGSGTRAKLAAEAKIANEQRERQRVSGGVIGLVYSDESEDDDDEDEDRKESPRAHTNGNTSPPDVARSQSLPQSDEAPSLSKPPSVKTPREKHLALQPALPLPATPPLPLSGSSVTTGTAVSSWTIDEVVSWAESRGFDDIVCAKLRGMCTTRSSLMSHRARDHGRRLVGTRCKSPERVGYPSIRQTRANSPSHLRITASPP
jgi:hypothetical protein